MGRAETYACCTLMLGRWEHHASCIVVEVGNNVREVKEHLQSGAVYVGIQYKSD